MSTDFSTAVYYGIFVFSLMLFILRYSIHPFFVSSYKEDFIAKSFFIVWFYGFILGLFVGNKTEYVIANFGGMVCYLIYFVFVRLGIDVDKIIKISLISGFILALYAIISMLSFLLGYNMPFLESNLDLASTGQIRVYFTNMSVIYPLFATSLSYLFFNHKYLQKLPFPKILFLLTFIALFPVSGSKGFILGGLYVVGVFFVFSTISSIHELKFKYSYIIAMIIGLIAYFVLDDMGYITIIDNIFSPDDESNLSRYDQLYYMINDLNFLGHGLGATISSIVRSEEGPYAFELVYINLIHKFGVFSLFLFYGWIYMFIRTFKYFKNPQMRKYGVFLVGSLGYLFPALGNPSLMHPSLVFLNSLTLYLLRQLNQSERLIVNKAI